MSIGPGAELVEPFADALPLFDPEPVGFKVSAELGIDRGAKVTHFAPPLQTIDQLLRAERDQDADHDDQDFLNNSRPTTDRFDRRPTHLSIPLAPA
jgi:hypothetical protein